MSTASLGPAGVRFEDLAEQAWPRQEIIDGSLHETPLAGVDHQVIVTRLSNALMGAVPPDLEVLTGVNVMRRSDTDRLLIPDVAVVETACLAHGLASVRPEDVYLAVEVISPSSRATDLHLKRQLYAEWNIGTYWVLDPADGAVHEFGLRESASCWLAEVDLSGIWPG